MEQRSKAIWGVVVVAGLCVATAGFFSVRFLLQREPKADEEKPVAIKSEDPAPATAVESDYMDKGIAAIKKEELRLAEALIKDFPRDDDPLIIMGEMRQRHGNAIEAVKYYEKALKINPMRPDVYTSLGDLSSKEGKFAEAISHFQKVLDVQPGAPGMYGRIGELYMRLGELDKAIESFEREMQTAPSADCYFMTGQLYLMQKDSEKAKANYEAAIKADPGHVRARYGLATVYSKLGNQDEAKVHFETYRKLKIEARKELKAARTMHDDIVQTRKNSAVIYIRAGQMYRSGGKLGKAEELLQRAAELDPENVGCLLELASLYRASKQQDKVVEMHEKIGRLELKHADNCIIFGNLSADLGLLDDAEEAYRKATVLAPANSMAHRKLALLYLSRNKELPEARRLAEKAVELEATGNNYSVLSRACLMNKDGAGALEAIKRALELDPRNREYQRFQSLVRRMN